ncbi:hypothetical protein, partial [Alistipes sp.]|uniref:hypothetical protein n=1 Tax=Alistipes sp. TaxID=1872444 RepID=UPI0025BACB1E
NTEWRDDAHGIFFFREIAGTIETNSVRIMKKTAIFLSVSLLAVQANAQEYYHDGVRSHTGLLQ